MAAEEVVQTPFGKFLITKGDLIGETTRAGTLWDGPGFLQVIAKEHGRLGEPGVTILDVGANQGAFSIWLASQGAWRVVAVEPVPQVMQRLKANLDLNREVTAGVVVGVAVAGYSCEARLSIGPFDPGNWGGTALGIADTPKRVQGRPLDLYQYLFGTRVSLIKVDAQGCDYRVLLGLTETITRDHPALVFEWEAELAQHHGGDLGTCLGWLTHMGYETHEWPTHPNNYLALWKDPMWKEPI